MKARIISDDHLEFRYDWDEYFDAVHPKYDGVLFHAGDLIPACHPRMPEAFQRLCERYRHVYYVLGNHDYYSNKTWDVEQVEGAVGLGCGNELSIFDSGHGEYVPGSNFLLAGTMWFPDTVELRMNYRTINDPFQIKGFDGMFQHKYESFKRLAEKIDSDVVVMTHHLPSERSTPLQYLNSPTQPFFLAPQDDLIAARKPKAWIHGHTHTPVDYYLGDTHVICNPVGYPHERPLPKPEESEFEL